MKPKSKTKAARTRKKTPAQTPSPEPAKAAEDHSADGWITHFYSTPDENITVVMPHDIAKYHGDPEEPTQQSYSSAEGRIKVQFDWLCQRAAKGDWAAVSLLVKFGTNTAHFLGRLSDGRPDLVKRFARTVSEWPVVISPEEDYPYDLGKIRRWLGLGENLILRRDKVLYRKKDQLQRQVVFYTMGIFTAARGAFAAELRVSELQEFLGKMSPETVCASERSASSNASPIAIACINGEVANTRRHKTLAFASFGNSQLSLFNLLEFPVTAAPLNREASEILTEVCELPKLSSASKLLWETALLRFLRALAAKELEENEVLRTLGQAAGDVVIRARCKTASSGEFNIMKASLRHDPGVNGAIRTRIGQKLKAALRAFMKEERQDAKA